MKLAISLPLFLAILLGGLAAQEKASVEVPFFGNTHCPIKGNPVDKALSVTWNGQRIWVCCKGCVSKVEDAPEAAYAVAYPAKKLVDLRNERCPVMGGKAKPNVSVDFQGHRVHFCCKGCDKRFLEEPNKHLALLTRKGLKDLKNTHCPIMTQNAVLKDTFVIFGDNLINICCPSCRKKIAEDPEAVVERLMKADKSRGKSKEG